MNANNRTILRQALAYGTLAAALLICLHLLRSSYLLWDLSLEVYLLLVGVPLGRHTGSTPGP